MKDHRPAPPLVPTGPIPEARRLFAECIGTFALTFFDCGAKMVSAISGEVGHLAQALAPGLVVAAMIYAIGAVSGAHINPAVTLAFVARGDFPWQRAFLYWIAQLLGATLAAALLQRLLGSVADLGATAPHGSAAASLVVEIVLSFSLVVVILGTATQHRVVGPNAAIAVGGIIVACGVFGKAVSGASMNPARSFGPAIVSGELKYLWIYILAPITGALAAVLATAVLHGPRNHEEKQAAAGDKAQ